MAVQMRDLELKILWSPINVKEEKPDEFLPDGMDKEKWYSVVASESWTYKEEKEGPYKGKIKTVLKYGFINEQYRLTFVADFNCQVKIDKKKKD